MAINLKHVTNDGKGWHERWMTVGKMKEILSTLPDDWEIEPNHVGNLSLCTDKGEFKGYIDFPEEEFKPKED